MPRHTIVVALAGLSILLGCLGQPRSSTSNRPQDSIHYVGPDRVEMRFDLPKFIAAGDSLTLVPRRYHCRADVCGVTEPWSDGVTWSTDSAHLATISPSGRLVAIAAGRVRVTAVRGDTTGREEIEVLPAVATFAWEPPEIFAMAGDTVHAVAVARDSAGRLIREIPVERWRSMEGDASHDYYARGGGLMVKGSGTFISSARLGSRVAELRIHVRPRR